MPIKADREPRGRWDSPWRITQLSGCEVRKKMNQEGKAGASLQRLHPVISLSSFSPLLRPSEELLLRVFPGPLFYTFHPQQRVATDRFPFSERPAPLRHPKAQTASAEVPFPSTALRLRLPGLPCFLRPPDATLATSSPQPPLKATVSPPDSTPSASTRPPGRILPSRPRTPAATRCTT